MCREHLWICRGNSWQRTKPVQIAPQFICIHRIHRAIESGHDTSIGDCTTDISKRWDTVGHKTPPYKRLYYLSYRLIGCNFTSRGFMLISLTRTMKSPLLFHSPGSNDSSSSSLVSLPTLSNKPGNGSIYIVRRIKSTCLITSLIAGISTCEPAGALIT